MTELMDDIPALQYRHTFVDGDRGRFEKAAMRTWLKRNPGLWTLMAFESVLIVVLGVLVTWWFLSAIPVLFVFFAAVTYWRTHRGNAHIAAGNQVATGYGETVLRIVDSTGQIIFPYGAFRSVRPAGRGWIGVTFAKGHLLMLPVEVCPPAVVAMLEEKIKAGAGKSSRPKR